MVRKLTVTAGQRGGMPNTASTDFALSQVPATEGRAVDRIYLGTGPPGRTQVNLFATCER